MTFCSKTTQKSRNWHKKTQNCLVQTPLKKDKFISTLLSNLLHVMTYKSRLKYLQSVTSYIWKCPPLALMHICALFLMSMIAFLITSGWRFPTSLLIFASSSSSSSAMEIKPEEGILRCKMQLIVDI